ncbi:hypothetical protein ABT158_48660 [Nonomuraea sp. NPDC001636]|uniref:hypothetical protein n=1 Tax=Nonomuraea sp. NPDC001636 TaxID=3154391 RepID=UPI00332A99F2
MIAALPWLAGWVLLTATACLITWRLTVRLMDIRETELWTLVYEMQFQTKVLKGRLVDVGRGATAFEDALNDIVDLADWADIPLSASGNARVQEVVAIAKQALETRAYPGRLRAAQEALEQAERDIQELTAENVRLAELAVAPQ